MKKGAVALERRHLSLINVLYLLLPTVAGKKEGSQHWAMWRSLTEWVP